MSEQLANIRTLNRFLGNVNALLKDPGGETWPKKYRLSELPVNTEAEELNFLNSAVRVANIVSFLDERVRPRLEGRRRQAVQQVVGDSLDIIRSSVENREERGYGLTPDVLDRSNLVVERLGLNTVSSVKEPSIVEAAQVSEAKSVLSPTTVPTEISDSDVKRDVKATSIDVNFATRLEVTMEVSVPVQANPPVNIELTEVSIAAVNGRTSVSDRPVREEPNKASVDSEQRRVPTAVSQRRVAESTPLDPNERVKRQVQQEITARVLDMYAEGRFKTISSSPANFISPFVPLGSELSTLIGSTQKDAMLRDRKIVEFVVNGIRRTLKKLYEKPSQEYTSQERTIASTLAQMSTGSNKIDMREIFASIYQQFRMAVPAEYLSGNERSPGVGNDQELNREHLNREDRYAPTDVRVENILKELREIRDVGVQRLSYRDESLVEFLDTFEKRVLFEDENILILNKPAGVASHHGPIHLVGILEAARHHRRSALHLAHRLDTDTSGALMMVKNREAHGRMRTQFGNKGEYDMTKLYIALLEGEFTRRGPIEVNVPVAPVPNSQRMQVVPPEAIEFSKVADTQSSKTIYFPLAVLSSEYGSNTLTDVQIVTGRTHQIRVVSADYLKHPVVGDTMYGAKNLTRRSLLHARELTFVHPFSDSRMTVSAPVPKDFSEYLLNMDWVLEIDEDRLDQVKISSGNMSGVQAA